MGDFYNIDNELNATTRWYSPLHNALYTGTNVEQSYTQIMEVPDAINISNGSVIEFANYWGISPLMITKFDSGGSPSTRRFRLTYAPIENTLKIYLSGVEIDLFSFPEEDKRYINITEPNDGYLRVVYFASNMAYAAGDKRATLWSAGVLGTRYMPPTGEENIIRARRAVNLMESLLGMRPSTWVGGPRNTIVSGPRNLVKSVSHVHYEHHQELQFALQRLQVQLATMVAYEVPVFTFSTIVETGTYVVEYIEEILSAVNSLETVIIANKDTLIA